MASLEPTFLWRRILDGNSDSSEFRACLPGMLVNHQRDRQLTPQYLSNRL